MRNVAAYSFRTLMDGQDHAEILSLTTGQVVRRLTIVDHDTVEIDALSDRVTVSLDTPITYEPWFMDRGSLLFAAPGFGDRAKIATEFDRIHYVSKEVCQIVPAR